MLWCSHSFLLERQFAWNKHVAKRSKQIDMVINKGGKFLKKRGAASVGEYKCSDDGLTLETSAFKLFAVANLCFQLSW